MFNFGWFSFVHLCLYLNQWRNTTKATNIEQSTMLLLIEYFGWNLNQQNKGTQQCVSLPCSSFFSFCFPLHALQAAVRRWRFILWTQSSEQLEVARDRHQLLSQHNLLPQRINLERFTRARYLPGCPGCWQKVTYFLTQTCLYSTYCWTNRVHRKRWSIPRSVADVDNVWAGQAKGTDRQVPGEVGRDM